MRNKQTLLDKSFKYNTIYIDQAKMQEASDKGDGEFTNELGKYVITLVDNLMYSTIFNFEHWQVDLFNEFKSRTLEKCVCAYYAKYDPERSTAFAFFNTVIRNYLLDQFRQLRSHDSLGGRVTTYVWDGSDYKLVKADVVSINELSNDGYFS